jgi:hypothetical protein
MLVTLLPWVYVSRVATGQSLASPQWLPEATAASGSSAGVPGSVRLVRRGSENRARRSVAEIADGGAGRRALSQWNNREGVPLLISVLLVLLLLIALVALPALVGSFQAIRSGKEIDE